MRDNNITLDELDALKASYTLRHKIEDVDELNKHKAIGKRTYDAERSWTNKQTSKITGRKKEKITEQFLYYIKPEDSQEKTGLFEYDTITIIRHTYTRITQKEPISRITSKVPKTTIKDKNHEIKHQKRKLTHPATKKLTDIIKEESFIYHTNKVPY